MICDSKERRTENCLWPSAYKSTRHQFLIPSATIWQQRRWNASKHSCKSPATPNGSTRELQHERRLQRRKEGDEPDKQNKTGPLRWHGNDPRHKDLPRS
nr:MAG TPA: hypothetical protein [Caudoviricetes sp.]